MAIDERTTLRTLRERVGEPGIDFPITFEVLTVSITSPGNNSLSDRSISVTGTVSCQEITEFRGERTVKDVIGRVQSVEISYGSSAFVSAKKSGSTWASWTSQRSVSLNGAIKITARARTQTRTHTHSITVRVDGAGPALTITTPTSVTIPEPPYTHEIKGRASDSPAGVARVEYRVGGGRYRPASNPRNNWSEWVAPVELPGLGKHTVTIRAVDTIGNATTRTVTCNVVDTSDPLIEIKAPLDGQTFTLIDGGTTIDVVGTTSDTQSKVALVDWSLDGRPFVAAIPQAPGDWSNWSAAVLVETPGPHLIRVRATDDHDNTATQDVEVSVGVPFVPKDPLAVVSPAAYLDDLLRFAADRIKAPAAGDVIDAELIAAAFHQRFDMLVEPVVRVAANQPVHRARVAIEVLRTYYTAHALSPDPEIELSYRQLAYEALLRRLGTSSEEVRLARGAAIEARRALAERLGITLDPMRPDQLDRLTLDPAQIEEADLERLFGLVDTSRNPLEAVDQAEPELLAWRRAHLRRIWRQQDEDYRSEGGVLLPIVDPDLIDLNDLRDPSEGNAAYDLWQARRAQVDAMLDELRTALDPSQEPLAVFDRIVAPVLGPIDELLALAEAHQRGDSIEPQLAERQIELEPFLYAMRLRSLAASTALLAPEWEELFAILVQVRKQREYGTWRTQEQERTLTLGPDYFLLNDEAAGPGASLPRRRWQEVLAARIGQDHGLAQALAVTVAAVEEETLPLLRDALVAAVDPALPPLDVANRLTQELLIDMRSNDSQKTTRVTQAIETLQGLMFALRTGSFANVKPLHGANPATEWSLNLSASYTEHHFDEEWQWMGAYSRWRSAIVVFGYPENYLLPSLREPRPENVTSLSERLKYPSDAFWALVDAVRTRPRLAPGEARYLANQLYHAGLDNELSLPVALKPGSFQLTEQLTEPDLSARRDLIRDLFGTSSELQQAPNYVQEIFLFVPLLLALQLQKAGQYLAALDWFQTIYAYNLPVDQRKIYYGLVLEEQIDTVYRREPDWVLRGLNPHDIARTRANAYTRFTIMAIARCFLDFADAEFTHDTSESLPRARSLYTAALELLGQPEAQAPEPSEAENPFPPNPVLQSMQRHAELNLFKLRSGLNIAGMERQREPLSTPDGILDDLVFDGSGQLAALRPLTLRPTPYRYKTLVERAKQLVTIAQQIEGAYLAALEKLDVEAYNLLKAKQDIGLAGAAVTLQDLRVTEARSGVRLAQSQQLRALTQVSHFDRLLNEGISSYERRALDFMVASTALQVSAAALYAAGALLETAKAVVSFGLLGDPGTGAGQAASALAGASSTTASIYQTLASYERRFQEWAFQRDLSRHDLLTARRQVQIAREHVQVVQQERAIAQMQAENAEEIAEFLANKFTNAELYEWMSGILGRVYSYFLQQATAMARLAQNQLAFERQEPAPSFIQADYWEAPAESAGANDGAQADRRGLTGSVRLLQDIFKLDQYAFETNRRTLQLAQTFSLAQLAPVEFQRFRETGVLRFATPMELFDRDFPGHYLRLIKRVRTSIVALVPPMRGVRATLSASGLSRVVIDGETFESIVVRRDPELVAFTSTSNATGLLELEPDDELLLPFEGMGVDTTWELQLPRPANPFDYNAIADILITIEYTALNSFAYRQQVIQQLDRSFSADRMFSFRDQFAEQWYDLHNPEQVAEPMLVRFTTRRDDFAPNIDELRIEHLVLYAVRSDGASFELPIRHLHYTVQGESEAAGGGATTVDGIVSTRRSNGSAWLPILGKAPIGAWELAFDDSPEVRGYFASEQIDNILFVITYAGRTPAWPL